MEKMGRGSKACKERCLKPQNRSYAATSLEGRWKPTSNHGAFRKNVPEKDEERTGFPAKIVVGGTNH